MQLFRFVFFFLLSQTVYISVYIFGEGLPRLSLFSFPPFWNWPVQDFSRLQTNKHCNAIETPRKGALKRFFWLFLQRTFEKWLFPNSNIKRNQLKKSISYQGWINFQQKGASTRDFTCNITEGFVCSAMLVKSSGNMFLDRKRKLMFLNFQALRSSYSKCPNVSDNLRIYLQNWVNWQEFEQQHPNWQLIAQPLKKPLSHLVRACTAARTRDKHFRARGVTRDAP